MTNYDVGAETLSVLTNQSSTAHDELTAKVRELAAAAEPLEGRFNGSARAAFDAFKSDSDQIAVELNAALAAVVEGIQGQNLALVQGEQEMEADIGTSHAGAGVETARFWRAG